MIAISQLAARKIREILDSEPELEGFGIRLGVLLGGPHGRHYSVSFTLEPEPGDATYNIEGLTVYVSPTADPFLETVVMDYDDSPEGSGFVFRPRGGRGSEFEV